MEILLVLAAIFLAYTNGANDNFKGVATLLGSRTAQFRTALYWGTGLTFVGSLTAVLFSAALVKTFSGKGLVPPEILNPAFLAAVGIGAATTVLIATKTGIPISTTHSLTGALVGAGLAAVGTQVAFSQLATAFFLPLLISPILSLFITFILYPIFRFSRNRLGVERETCVCIESSGEWVPVSNAAAMTQTNPSLSVRVDDTEACADRYQGNILGINAQRVLDGLHFLTAGAVSFARGLNDTPKIMALLAGAQILTPTWGSAVVGIAMAAGGLISAKKVAKTMSYDITGMNSGQGFTANLVTAFMVLGASRMGVPVSTTHVSCGSLFGLGMANGEAQTRTIGGILLAWGVTLPLAALLAGLTFLAIA